MSRKAQPLVDDKKQGWLTTQRCAFCECPVYIHKDGYAITPVAGEEHLCGINCACRHDDGTASAGSQHAEQ